MFGDEASREELADAMEAISPQQDPEWWHNLLSSTSIAGMVFPGRSTAYKIAGVLTRSGQEESTMLSWNDDPMRRNVIASLSPAEEIQMALFGNTPVTQGYYQARQIYLAKTAIKSERLQELHKSYKLALIEKFADDGNFMQDKLSEEIKEALNADSSRLTQENVEAMWNDPGMIADALNIGIAKYGKKLKQGIGDQKRYKQMQEWYLLLDKARKAKQGKSFSKTERANMEGVIKTMMGDRGLETFGMKGMGF
jgi:hypothetical protein